MLERPLPNPATPDSPVLWTQHHRVLYRVQPRSGSAWGSALFSAGSCLNGHPSAKPGCAGTFEAASWRVEEVRQTNERQELLWHVLFQDPTRWWDNRQDKRSSRHPDFRHKASKEPLWLDSRQKPGWVDAQLAKWDAGHGCASRIDPLFETVSKCCEEGQLEEAVQSLDLLLQLRCYIDPSLFYSCLKRCIAHKDLVLGRRLHVLAVKSGFECNAFLANHLIAMYASHGKLKDAMQVFTKVTDPNVYMWATIILAHARHGQPTQAIQLYRQMRDSTVSPDNRIFVAVLKACATAKDLVSGKEVHAHILASELKADVFVANSLVTMYAKCGSLEEAHIVFCRLQARDDVTWTAMMAGYTQHGMGGEALALYAEMQREGITPTSRAMFVCLLQACASVRDLEQGKQLHDQIRECELASDSVIGNCLVDMYSKCGSLQDARRIFDTLPTRDVVTWNTMLAGYTQHGLSQDALALYASMQQEGITPADNVTYMCLLKACAELGALHQGKQLHAQIREQGLESDLCLGSSLVDLYAKCGSLENARNLFDGLAKKDLVTWTSMLNGYAEHGDGRMAIWCFEEMLKQGVEPDETTYICLFVACSHAGLVHEGQHHFKMMVERRGIVPTDYHHSCMVDLLGRSGKLQEAENMLRTRLFVNDIVAWTALLSACKSYGDVERGRRCFDRLVELEADDASAYALLGSIYAKAGRWNDVDRIESLRRSAGAMKKPAKACIEVKNEVHEFTVGEGRPDIVSKSRSVNVRLKEEGGHVPQTELVFNPSSEQVKEDALCGHAEKLALAYGLLHTPDGATLLVTKNLRMCDDCHSSTKIMSRLEKREIIVRDAHRVHRFLDGFCSCKDRH